MELYFEHRFRPGSVDSQGISEDSRPPSVNYPTRIKNLLEFAAEIVPANGPTPLPIDSNVILCMR